MSHTLQNAAVFSTYFLFAIIIGVINIAFLSGFMNLINSPGF